jgi:hypothetical protein
MRLGHWIKNVSIKIRGHNGLFLMLLAGMLRHVTDFRRSVFCTTELFSFAIIKPG